MRVPIKHLARIALRTSQLGIGVGDKAGAFRPKALLGGSAFLGGRGWVGEVGSGSSVVLGVKVWGSAKSRPAPNPQMRVVQK